MSELYDYGARNGLSIITNCGRVTEIRFADNTNKWVVLERGIADSRSFLSALKPFMDNLAEHRPHKFIKLFLSLTDDAEALELATDAYDLYMDKRFYPLEDIKSLMSEPEDSLASKEQISYYGTANDHRVGVKNGIIVIIFEGSPFKRNEPEFISTVTSFLMVFVDMEPQEFMELYDAIGNDKICFKIADRIRKETARKWITLFRYKEESSSTSNTATQSFDCEPMLLFSDRIFVNDGIITSISTGNRYIERDNATFYDVLNKSLRVMACSNQDELARLCDSIRSDETYYNLARGILDSTREKAAQYEVENTYCFTHQSLF